MYYGLFTRVGGSYVRIDTTTGYTLETAKREFAPLVKMLLAAGFRPVFRKLPPVKQIDPYTADKKYAKTPW